MRRRNYLRILAWCTPENIARFYAAIDGLRRKRQGVAH
jgi:hypothetical protein